ncbi:hypothetical protein [Legionella yabuuchiae]|uniref:hypothetical protein n=1 Tax=Legionella yabuuchiae TaxID=376727 RepID=UPI001056C730|nr:hypothetical protein [Legionella yabuuchiae]
MKLKFVKYTFFVIAFFVVNITLAYIKQSKEASTKLSSTQKNSAIFAGIKESWVLETCKKLISIKDNMFLHKATQESCIAAAEPAFDACVNEYELSTENLTQTKRLENFSICFVNNIESTLRKE